MRTELKFIGQYTASIIGTSKNELIDIFYDNKDIMYLYRRYSDGDFNFEVIKENDYNSNKFDAIILDASSYMGMRLFHSWRQSYVDKPKLMPMEYYYDILSLYTKMEKKKENIFNEIMNDFKSFELKITDTLER